MSNVNAASLSRNVSDNRPSVAYRNRRILIPEIPKLSIINGKCGVILRSGGPAGITEPHIVSVIGQKKR